LIQARRAGDENTVRKDRDREREREREREGGRSPKLRNPLHRRYFFLWVFSETQDFLALEVGRDGLPEKSVMNYHSTLRNIPEERRSRGLIMEDFIFITAQKRASIHSRYVTSGCTPSETARLCKAKVLWTKYVK